MSATAAVLLAGALGPSALLGLLDDAGFRAAGQTLELATWPRIEASPISKRIGGINTDQRTREGNIEHKDMLLKTGQAVQMHDVPVRGPATVMVQVRVDPVWNAGSAMEPVLMKVTAGPPGEKGKSVELTLAGPRDVTDRWHDLGIDVGEFAGSSITVSVQPAASADGIWTNWRDLRVAPAP